MKQSEIINELAKVIHNPYNPHGSSIDVEILLLRWFIDTGTYVYRSPVAEKEE